MPFKVTTKGRFKLKRAGALISEHTQETEAFESAIRHAESNGSGLYTIEPPVRELDVSVLSRVVFDPDSTPPTTPGLVVATALSQTVIRVTWTASVDTGGSGLAGYRVLRSTSSGGTYAQVGSDLSVASLSFDDSGLVAGSTHFYRVVAFDGNNNVSAASSPASATTQAANPNTGLSWPVHSPGYLSLIPGVGGYGMDTMAGSGRHLSTPATTVILVNSLASGNSGAAASGLGANVFAGTWEYAWRHAASPKVIIPIVSGWVTVQDSLPCQTGTPPRPGYVTYYGQAAPNPGLFLRGANVAGNGANDIAVWHLRSYMGDDVAGLPAGNRDCFSSGYGAGTTSRVVLINCEFAWSVDEICDFNRSHSEVTLVNCAFVEPLHASTIIHPEDGPGFDHGFGPIIGGDTGNPTQTATVSAFRNLWAHTTGRNPLISARTYTHANNLHYNHGRPGGGAGSGVQIISAGATEANTANIIGNAFIRGPNNDTNLVAVSVASSMPAGSAGYSAANSQFGWSAANQNSFFTSSPAGYIGSTVQSAAYPGSWGSGLGGVLQWAANPLAPTAAEWTGLLNLMEGTVGAQPRWRSSQYGRVDLVFDQIRNRLNGVAQTNQFVDTVTQAGGWFSVPTVTINPLSPGTHWHAPLPTGSDRDTPYTTGAFSDGKSRVGYTRLEEWAYEQHLYVTQIDLISPTIPVNVSVTAQSTTTLRVAWDASTDAGGSGLAGYRVYRSTTSGGTYTLVSGTLSASTLSFDDTTLSANTTRWYRVSAVDGNSNESSQSTAVSGTTQSSGTGLILFQDDFSSGDLRKAGPNGGFFWGGHGGPGDGTTGVNMSVISGFSRHGNTGNCLRFIFPGTAPSSAEQRFSFGAAYPQIWLRWYQYFPNGNESPSRGPLVRRTGGFNNKFLRLYGVNEASPRFGSETFITSPSGDEICNIEAAVTAGAPSDIGGLAGSTDIQLLNNANRGRWFKIEWHCKPSTSTSSPNGELRCWIDDVLRSQMTGINSFIAGGSTLGGGYLWGSQNGAYVTAGTQLYVSDFAVSATGRV